MAPEKNTELEEYRARKEQREALRAKEAEARELEELKLEEKYEVELNGKRGVDFEIINTSVGLFVVRKPEFVVAKRFSAAEKKTEEDIIAFVRPCLLFPDSATVATAFMEHAGVAWKCALACLDLYGAVDAYRKGKY